MIRTTTFKAFLKGAKANPVREAIGHVAVMSVKKEGRKPPEREVF
jgi:hypothetical protein